MFAKITCGNAFRIRKQNYSNLITESNKPYMNSYKKHNSEENDFAWHWFIYTEQKSIDLELVLVLIRFQAGEKQS